MLVLELMMPGGIFDLVEPVHVQLADEGGVVLGFKEFGEYLRELFDVFDVNRLAMVRPLDCPVGSLVLVRLTSTIS